MSYKIPHYKVLCMLADQNVYTERYDGIFSSFSQVPKSYNYILMINSINHYSNNKYDGEWVKINGEWERPDGSVPPYARVKNYGVLKV